MSLYSRTQADGAFTNWKVARTRERESETKMSTGSHHFCLKGQTMLSTYISLTKSKSMVTTPWSSGWRGAILSYAGKEGNLKPGEEHCDHSQDSKRGWAFQSRDLILGTSMSQKGWSPIHFTFWSSLASHIQPIISIPLIPSTVPATKSLKQNRASKPELIMSEPKNGGPAFCSEAHIHHTGLFPIPHTY